MKFSAVVSLGAALLASAPCAIVNAQAGASKAYTDPATGITFQAVQHASGFRFGVALPPSPGADFIGLLSAPKKVGWAAGDLGPGMVGKLLIVAWPDEKNVVASVRKATRKSNPSEFPAGGNLTAIPKGTFVDGDHWQYTFVCKGCLAGTTGFATTAAEDRLAFAMSNNPPAQAANKASQLNFHNAGTGQFMLKLGDAKSDKYAAWSKLV